jgi:hypothetical protein
MSENGTFSARVVYADSEYMLDVLNGPILAEKVQKSCFLAEKLQKSCFLVKSGKTPPKKNFFFYLTK